MGISAPPKHEVIYLLWIVAGAVWILASLGPVTSRSLTAALIGGGLVFGGLAEWIPLRLTYLAGALRLLYIGFFLSAILWSVGNVLRWGWPS